MGRGYLVVEGRGEVKAVQNLIVRLWNDLGCNPCSWADPIRGQNLLRRDGIVQACSIVRSKPEAEMLLILRDADDDCPAISGPTSAQWVREETLPFPTAVVLFHREYETLFLPCLARMVGIPLRDERNVERPGLIAGTAFSGDYEATRGVKEWLSKRFPAGKNYKPTVDQLPMTRLIDFGDLRTSGLPSFGTLERALRFLDDNRGHSLVYPGELTI